MKKIVTGISLLSMFAFAVGCSDDNTWIDEANTGNASFALSSGDFSLSGTLTIVNSQAVAVVDGEAIAEDGPASLEFSLAPDTYTPALTGWTLFESGVSIGEEADEEDNIVFTGFVVNEAVVPTFDVTAGAETAVSLQFDIGADDPLVITTNGDALLSLLTVVEPSACDPVCTGGDVCAEIDGNDPACVTTCTTPGDASAECGAGTGNCVAASGSNYCEFL